MWDEILRARRSRCGVAALGLIVSLTALHLAAGTSFAEGDPILCHKCDSAVVCDGEGDDPPTAPPTFTPQSMLDDTDLLHVDLSIDLDFTGQTVSGMCVLTLHNLDAPLNNFDFRLRNNFTITQALLNGATPVTVNTIDVNTRRVIFPAPIAPDTDFTLTIVYNGSPVNLGFGSFSWTNHGSGPTAGTIAATLSEPYYAYSWWPCKDGEVLTGGDNSDKFLIDMTVTSPSTMKVAGNGLLQSATDIGGGKTAYHWRSNYPIATYLVSLGATNYNKWVKTYTHPNGTMPVEFYVYPSSDTPSNRLAWEKCIDMLAAFRQPFGEYPFIDEKYGIYQFPFTGGMEHQTMSGQGAVTFTAEYITAHELGHQWWGDMITCRSWEHIWLNEGFATFSEAIWQERKPGGSMAAYHAQMAARKPTSFAGTVYRSNVSSASNIFSSNFAYRKGGWVVHMLRHMLGDTAFFQTLADYRAAYEYSVADTEDFAAVCSLNYGEDLTWFFNQWVYRTGAPTYELSWSPHVVNGEDYLLARIRQTQQVAWGMFEMPVDLRITGGGIETVPVWNNQLDQYFAIPRDAAPTNVELDPEEWILHGTTTTSAWNGAPAKILTTAPMPGDQVSSTGPVSAVDVNFLLPVNVTDVQFSLTGATTGARAFALQYLPATNTARMLLESPLPIDNYTLHVEDTVTSVVGGLALDGDVAVIDSPASLPSGNGTPGGTAKIAFSVVRHPADINADSLLSGADVSLFVQVLLGLNSNPTIVARCDFNASGVADGNDIQMFVSAFYN